MAYEEKICEVSLIAGADLSANQYRFVKISAARTAALCSAAGEKAFGVLTNKPTSGQTASVAVGGVAMVKAGAAISAGDAVATDASGKAKTAVAATVDTTGSNATEDTDGSFVMGIAVEAAAADGDIIAVLIQPQGAIPTTAS